MCGTLSSMTVKRALLLILMLMAGRTAMFGLFSAMGASNADAGSRLSGSMIAVMAVAGAAILSAIWFLSAKQLGRTLLHVGWTFDSPARVLIAALAGFLASLLFLFALYAVLGQSPSELLAQLLGSTALEYLQFLVTGIVASVAEETLFRGNLQQALEKHLPVLPAVLVCAVVFSLYHLNFRPVGLVSKFLLGLIFSGTAKSGRSLTSSGIAHSMFWVAAGTA